MPSSVNEKLRLEVLDYVDSLEQEQEEEDETTTAGEGDRKNEKKQKKNVQKSKNKAGKKKNTNTKKKSSENESDSKEIRKVKKEESMNVPGNETTKSTSAITTNTNTGKKTKKKKNNISNSDGGDKKQTDGKKKKKGKKKAPVVGAISVEGIGSSSSAAAAAAATSTTTATTSYIHSGGEILVHATLVDDEEAQTTAKPPSEPNWNTIEAGVSNNISATNNNAPVLVEAKRMDRSHNNKLLLWIGIILVLLIVLCLAIILPITLTKNKNDSATAPEIIDDALQNLDARKILPILATLSDPALIAKDGTPQNKAAKWILDDVAQMDAEPDESYVQRYILAVLYYTTHGDTRWQKQLNFLQPINTCDWNQPDDGNSDLILGAQCDDDDTIFHLRISNNGLHGAVPVEIQHLTALQTLELSDGMMGGRIPREIGNLSNLRYLSLRGNDFFGDRFPKEIPVGLSKLEYLYLNNNRRLGGHFPTEFGDIPTLHTIHIENTSLIGNLNFSVCKKGSDQPFNELVADCASSQIRCCCCTYCCDPFQYGECDSTGSTRQPTCQ
jgi:hypothetical protein